MASLNDSKTFQLMNKSSNLSSKILKLVQTSVVLDKSYIEEQYIQMSKTRISPISAKVLNAFDEGRIKLFWNKDLHLTIAVPFVVLTIGGKLTGCIFISDFSSMNKDATAITIEMKKLYTLMESAYLGVQYFTTPDKFTKNGAYLKTMADIYSSMVLKILNRDYALSLDKDVYDSVNYTAARFFLERVIGLRNRDLTHAYAVGVCKSPTPSTMTLAEDLYNATEEKEETRIKTTEDLIKFIVKISPKMGNLTYRYFFERWISSYGQGACLSIDSYPYFYYVVANVLIGGFLVNTTALNELIKNTKGIDKVYAELSRII